MSFKHIFTQNLLNIPGWRTKRNIVVFESDDWGAIRMPSRDVYKKLLSEGYSVDKIAYESNDSLARVDDLCALFEVLSKYKDRNGNHPVITANCVVANPDFERIRDSDFQQYFYEPITETFKRYNGCENSFSLWKQGMMEGLFHPQFHGREHLNVTRWMNALQTNDIDTRHVFDYGLMGLFPKDNYSQGNVFQVALDNTWSGFQQLEEILADGLDMFEQLFGYKSKTFIAPCYTWHPQLEKRLYEKGVIGLQGMVYQKVPGEKPIRHYMGDRNPLGQVYTIRNCFFEPTKKITIDECINRINCAFRWHKPAVISTHRINFIGALREENRTENLKQLESLIQCIFKNWSDVEFISSDKLVEQIIHDQDEY